jgi:hypothetical protein
MMRALRANTMHDMTPHVSHIAVRETFFWYCLALGSPVIKLSYSQASSDRSLMRRHFTF